MIIAVALLGFGATGSLVAVLQGPLLKHFRLSFGLAALGFGAGAPLAFALAQSLPFNALEIAWDRAQPAWLFALYLVLAVPFLSGGSGAGAGFPGERRACRCALSHGSRGRGTRRARHGLPSRRAAACRCAAGRRWPGRRLGRDCAAVGESTTTRAGRCTAGGCCGARSARSAPRSLAPPAPLALQGAEPRAHAHPTRGSSQNDTARSVGSSRSRARPCRSATRPASA